MIKHVKAYYGSRISEHMTKTPEGFLICLGVPIARTGDQEYLHSEMGLDGNDLVTVHRLPDEVFAAAAIASFEGKPVTDEHPSSGVYPGNASAYLKGHAQNVRRGSGEESDLLLADLFVMDVELMRKIESGVREVSCGYECMYERNPDGTYNQCSIRGNHVAVVKSGRAGDRVKIEDSKPEPNGKDHHDKGGKPRMSNKNYNPKTSLFGKMFAAFAKDADPGEVANAVDELMEQAKEGAADETPPVPVAAKPADQEPVAPAEPAKDQDDPLASIVAALAALTAKVDALCAKNTDSDPDPLEKLAGELQAAADPEAAVTVPAEEVQAVGDEDETVTDEESAEAQDEDGAEVQQSADSRTMLAAIKAIKPIIAKLPEGERRAAADAASRQLRRALGKDATPRTNGYGAIAQARRQGVKDSAPKDDTKLGQDIMARYNPHYKNK